MSGTVDFNADAAKAIERVYKTPDVSAQRAKVLEALSLKQGERALDIGIGPGLLAYDMAATVGDKGLVAGIDLSDPMIEMTAARCADFQHVEFKNADATQLPFDDASFNAAVSTQVYEYVADMDKALADVCRVLKPGGRLVILDTAWDSVTLNVADRDLNERIFKAWEEHLVHPNLPVYLGPMLERNGFQIVRTEIIPMFSPSYHRNNYSSGILMMIGNFVKGRQGLTEDDVKRWTEDQMAKAESGDFFFSLNRYLFSAVKVG